LAKSVPLTKLGLEIERRIKVRIQKLQPDDPAAREALLRIGLLVESEAKLNVRRRGIVDTGRLMNSIRHEVYQRGSIIGVRVGSFGVPYAAMHEFGGPFTDRQRRAMFAALRDRGKLGPRRGVDKNVIQGGRFMDRPYLRPAVVAHKQRIIDIIRSLFR